MQSKQLKIKVCGLCEPNNIAAVAKLAPAYMGFVFYDKSPRFAGCLNQQTISNIPPHITPVAVFLNASVEQIRLTCRKYGIKTVQLHGCETPQMCKTLSNSKLTVFKAATLTSQADIDALQKYVGIVDMFVFDTKTADGTNGGSGHKWDWSLLNGYNLGVPFLLSGGIGANDVDAIIAAAAHPAMAGIDVNSRFETSPGIKDITLLTTFIKALKR
jgi:phosphoribosylanthranilate isomerase